ncbi:focadhesin isoform X3 [Cricetulus griseus]|uniref:focadhesin isoform X3 n=1 Tax=Cricetulus griseus TaxID=10029 RepID=UPI0015C3C567|nr:focadhesin isoform X3 [Cricetulus griseus]
MSDDIKKRFDFPNSLIQSQAVGHLIAAVLKEHGVSEKIHQATNQTAALNLLWEKCCSDNVVVRTACCEGLVALVAQGHAEFSYVLNGILNLIPSTRNMPGLIKALVKLLQMQALKEGQSGEKDIQDIYTIRNHPHPLITVLEHRPDCWPLLLQQLTAFFQQCPERSEVSCIQIMAPFLWYLYCEPSQLEEHTKLRLSLLKVLLQPRGLCDEAKPSVLEQHILQLCCNMVPSLQMGDLTQTTEMMLFIEEVYLSLLRHPVFWKSQLTQLTLQLLCICEVSLKITGECSSLIQLLECSIELLGEDFPVKLVIIGIALLLLQTPASQQKPILNLALKLLSLAEGQKIPKASLLLVVPLLQILSSTTLEECLAMGEEGPSRQQLALNLLEVLQRECYGDDHHMISCRLTFPITSMYGSIFTAWRVLEVIGEDSAASDWLAAVESLLPVTTVIPTHVFLLLAHLLIEDAGQNLQQILKVTAQLAQADSSQVVCIRSTWNALSPKLSCDTRPLILKTLSELFSLVPSLTVNTVEYENFKVQVLSFLWTHTQNKDPIVASAAYKSLSHFSAGDHTILHLPEKIRPEMPAPDELDEEEVVDLSIPGSCYIRLLTITASSVLPALEEFFTSLVKQEMVNMPRGIYHSALKGGMRSDQGKTVSGIPNFILKMYETNKQPGLKPGLAGGMLFCYDVPMYQSKDGKPLNRLMASRGRNFKQTSLALVHEVHVQPSEWHHALFLPQAWLAYMTRAYHAVLQGRIAELDLQLQHGKEGPEEVQYKRSTAWLWVRDMLTDEITKTAAKESPMVKGNALLALSSLAVVVSKHEASLSSDSDGVLEVQPNFLPVKEWVSMVLNTLLVIVDSHYRPRGQLFSCFYHKSYSGENTASAIARSAAATALSLLVPVFIISCKEKVEEILNMLTARLPGKPSADESQAVQIHMGLALGMFLSRLCEEKLSDMSGQQMNLLLMKSLDALENCCFDPSLEHNTGCVLGVGLALSLMSHSSHMESRVHVAASLRKLSTYLDDSGSQSRTFQETSGFTLALGNLVHGLSVCGHGKAEDLGNRLLPNWIKVVLTEGASTMLCLAALHGLVALVGADADVMQLKSEAIQSSHFQARLNEVIRTLTEVINVSGVIGLQSNAIWLLGHLHLSTLSSNQSRTSVPTDYSYLPEGSFIRAAIGFFVTGGKKGPEAVPPSLLKVVMKPIATVGESYQYPPANLAALLSPLMRLNFGEEIQQLCLEIAVTQAPSSQSAAALLGLWVMPPLIHGLSLNIKRSLLVSMSLWVKHVSDEQIQAFVENLVVAVFKAASPPSHPELCSSALQGLSQAMKLPSPSHHLWSLLCDATGKIFDLLPNRIRRSELELYISVAKCLSEMTDEGANQISQINKDNIEKAAFVKLYLISQGRLPLMSLMDLITAAVQHHEKEPLAWMILHSLYQARIVSHANTGVLKRLEWLLELMGYMRNLAYQQPSVQSVALDEALDYLLLIFAAAVVAWADHEAPLLLGLSASWLPWHRENGPGGPAATLLGKSPMHRVTVQEVLTLLPSSMLLLLQKDPWREQTQKFIDWLFSIMEIPNEAFAAKSKDLLKATLLSLRVLPEFKKKAVWTRAYGW